MARANEEHLRPKNKPIRSLSHNSKSEWHQAKIIRTTTRVIQGGALMLRQHEGGAGQQEGGAGQQD